MVGDATDLTLCDLKFFRENLDLCSTEINLKLMWTKDIVSDELNSKQFSVEMSSIRGGEKFQLHLSSLMKISIWWDYRSIL